VNILLALTLLAADTGGPRVYVSPVTISPAAARVAGADLELATGVAERIVAAGTFEAFTNADIRAVLEDLSNKQLLGCDSVDCQARIAGLADSQLFVRMEIGLLAGSFVVNGTLIDPRAARILKRRGTRLGVAAELPRALGDVAVALVSTEESAPALVAVEPLRFGGRVLTIVSAQDDLLDATASGALEARLAERVATETGATTVARQEVKHLVEALVRLQQTGVTDAENAGALQQIAAAANAEVLLVVELGRVGPRVVASASLLEGETGVVAGRSSLLLPGDDLLAVAAENVALGVFGHEAAIPEPPPDPGGFQAKMVALAEQIETAFAPYQTGVLSRLAVLPLLDRGSTAQARSMGAGVASVLERTLADELAVPMAGRERLEELAATQPLSAVAGGTLAEQQEAASFLGATVLVTGSVTDLGSDFMVEIRLVHSGEGEVRRLHTFVPMGLADHAELARTFVARSRAGAIFRAVIPGWGQFYNGPAHHPKGYLVVGGTASGLVSMGIFLFLASKKEAERSEWDTGQPEFFANDCAATPSVCVDRRAELRADADRRTSYALISVAVAAAFYLYGFVDAGIYGGTYTE